MPESDFSKILGLGDLPVIPTDLMVPDNLPVEDATKPTPLRVKIIPPGLAYNGSINRGSFKSSEYNLNDVANALDREAMVRRSFESKRTLIWKKGFSFMGKNPNAVAYVKERFRQIAQVSDLPTEQLFRDIADQLVTYSNAYVAKVRKNEASGGYPRKTFDGRQLEPVAGYYVLCATTMRVDRAPSGQVRKYQQVVPGQSPKKWPEWTPENMIHIYIDRKAGLATGTPKIIPVLDDIRALRSMEENVERMVYRYSEPLIMYMVGTETRPAKPGEVEAIQFEVERLPLSGGIAVPERHDIKIVGTEGQVLDVSEYLEHFLNRVRTGLHLSTVDVGEGDSSSRGTSLTMDKDKQDTVEEYQSVIKTFINFFMIDEILAEGDFRWDAYDDTNKVELFIPPVDAEEQFKQDNHALLMYQGDAIDEAEMRRTMGREPVQETQRENMWFERITKPSILIKASVTTPGEGTSARTMPTNQYGTSLTKPRVNKTSSEEETLADELLPDDKTYRSIHLKRMGFDHLRPLLDEQWQQFKKGMVESIDKENPPPDEVLESFLVRSSDMMKKHLMLGYRLGFDDLLKDDVILTDEQKIMLVSDAANSLDIAVGGLGKAGQEVITRLHRAFRSREEITTSLVRSTADALSYRIALHLSDGLMRSMNLGRLRSLQAQNYATAVVPGCCDTETLEIDITGNVDHKQLPPYRTHPNCTCLLQAPT